MEQPKIKLLPSEPVRICTCCGEGKTLNNENFSYRIAKEKTYKNECKGCESVKWVKRRRENPFRLLYQNKKKHCKKTGVEFDLTEEYIESIAPTHCPVFPWLELNYFGGKKVDNTASIDRINPKGGYTKGNVQILSLKANRCKSNLNEKEQMAIAMFFIRSNK